jgi:uncharacterized protein (DUF885 family)
MRAFAKVLFPLLFAGAAGAAHAAVEPPAWVKESNEHSLVLLHAIAQFAPEYASYLGVEGYDDQVTDLKPKVYERQQKAGEKVIKELKARLARATDPAVRQDLEIMILSAQDNMHSAKLQYELTVPYFSASATVFQGIRTLLDPRISKERQAHAVMRLKRYAGMTPDSKPITQLARERTEERLSDKKLLRPYKGEVEQNLNDAPSLVKGLRDLFANSGLDGWQDAMATLEKQLAGYDEWVRATILPQARSDHRLPEALYADSLKQFGVDIPPAELVERALFSFAEIRNEMSTLAPLVARQQNIKATDYRDVIRALKKKQATGKAILPLFEDRNAKLEQIIEREKIVTLPTRKAVIRLASEAESAMSPAPNMRPPRLIGNTGEYGEFVLPLVVPTKGGEGLRMDDFTHEAGSWSLTAHEARPGHELQFSAMVEKGISTARAVFAFNSVNVEGWGLYAEAEMKPYLPLEGQLCSLQFRLQRAARAFLDPMVNSGQMTPEQVKDFLMNEVVLSEAMAKQEVDRYTFRAPGQATSYFYGYQRLQETRQRAEIALRDKFDRKAFNDFVLSQGLLPPKLLEKAVMADFVKAPG